MGDSRVGSFWWIRTFRDTPARDGDHSRRNGQPPAALDTSLRRFTIIPASFVLITIGVIVVTEGLREENGYLGLVGAICLAAGGLALFRLLLYQYRLRQNASTQTQATISGINSRGPIGDVELGETEREFDDSPPPYEDAIAMKVPSAQQTSPWAYDNPALQDDAETEKDAGEPPPPPPYEAVKHIHTQGVYPHRQMLVNRVNRTIATNRMDV